MEFISKQIEICRCETSDYTLFERLHYLKGICKGSSCFLFKIDGVVGAFASLLALPLRGRTNAVIFHRIVILEQFQGLGLSSMIVNLLGGIFKAIGKDVYLKTDNTRMGKMLANNIQWKPTLMNRRTRKLSRQDHQRYKTRHRRAAFSFRYEGNITVGYEAITKPIREVREGYLLGRFIPVNVLRLAEVMYQINDPEFLKMALTHDFKALSDIYEGIYVKKHHPEKLFTTDCLIKRKEFKGASREYVKRLLFINAVIRIGKHNETKEALIYNLLKENYQQQFNLGNVEVVKIALKAYNTNITKYSKLIEKVGTHSTYRVNREVADSMNISAKSASNIARKQLRADIIAKFYHLELTDEENIKHMATNGFNISLSTLKRWRKDNNFTKYNKSVIPTT